MALEKINSAHLVDFIPNNRRCKTNFITVDVRKCTDWFREYRSTDLFCNPKQRISSTKANLSALFQNNPDTLKQTIKFCRENINQLSVDAVHDFLLDKGLPCLLQTINKEKGDNEKMNMSDLFEMYRSKTLNIKTVQNWMKKLGFKFEPRRKSYYADTHESKENVEYRSKFIDTYFEYELLAHCWHSISESERNIMISEGKLGSDSGYKYELDDGVYYEYHVDDHPLFQAACDHLEFGGNLSVRKPNDKKKVMMMGQDEAIMKQHLLTLLTWTLPDGSRPLSPKDEGYGLMLSGFTLRELGFGFTIPPMALKEINAIRKTQKYSDETAALEINGTVMKPKLTTSPFLRFLQYGKNQSGYWTYNHMVLQMEDCVDCLKFLYPDFNFVFFMDHSNGHNRMRPDGLNLNLNSLSPAG